jgi:hypothetical protein
MCGEISLKLCQMNWNVAMINVIVVVDELPSQITDYTCLTLIFGLDGVDAYQRNFLRIGAICPNWWASSKIGAKSFPLY